MCSIANVYEKQSKYTESLSIHHEVLEIRLRTVGPEHPHVAATVVNIANVYQAQGLYDKALETYEKSLKIDIKVHGLDHLVVADTKVCHLNTWRHDHSVDDEPL